MINVPSVKKYLDVVPKMPGSMGGSESGSDPKTCSENSMAYYGKSKTSPVAEEQKLKILSVYLLSCR